MYVFIFWDLQFPKILFLFFQNMQIFLQIVVLEGWCNQSIYFFVCVKTFPAPYFAEYCSILQLEITFKII